MKKKTIIIVVLALVFALIAVSVIATFPTYLFEDTKVTNSNSEIQSGNITENKPGTQVDGFGILAGDNDENGAGTQTFLPNIDDTEAGLSQTPDEDLVTLAVTADATLKAENGAFPEGTEFDLNKLGIFNKKYYLARHYTRGFAKNFVAYEFSATKDGKTIEPDGLVRIYITVPEKYNIGNVALYYLLPDGGVQELECTVDKTEGSVTANAPATGVYILVEKKDAENTDADADKDTSNDNSSSDSSNTQTPSQNSSTTSSVDADDNSSADSGDNSKVESTVTSDNNSSNTSNNSSGNASDNTSSNTSGDPSDNGGANADLPDIDDSSSDSSDTTSSDPSDDTSSEPSGDSSDTSSEDTSSDVSSNTSSDSSEDSSSDSSSDTSSDVSSDTESDNSSDSSSDSSSDNTSSEDPQKDTMDGWTPWY